MAYYNCMGPASPYVTWRVRVAAIGAAVIVCAAVAALLVIASHTEMRPGHSNEGVAALVDIAPRARAPSRTMPPARAPGAPAPSDIPASTEMQILSRLLACLDRRIENRPRNCPREPPPSEWHGPQLAVGGDFAPPPGVDFDAIYTVAEQRTLVMPSCRRDSSNVCIRFGARPPPPSRSAEEICRDANMGGPCTPPPSREDDIAPAP